MANIFEGARRITKLISGLAVLGVALALPFNEPYVSMAYKYDVVDSEFILDGHCEKDSPRKYAAVLTQRGKKIHITICFQHIFFNGDKFVLLPRTGRDLFADKPLPSGKFDPDAYIAKYASSQPAGGFDISTARPVADKPLPSGKIDWSKYADSPTSMFLSGFSEERRKADAAGNTELAKRIDRAYRMLEAGELSPEAEYSRGFSGFADKISESFVIPSTDQDAANKLWWNKKLSEIKEYCAVLLSCLAVLWLFVWAIGWIVRGFMGIPTGSDHKPLPKNADS